MAHLIIIDDESSMRSALRSALERFGHVITEASDGRTGLALIDPTVHQVVITDIVMPGTEGLEVLMELRRQHSKLKVIAMSGGGRLKAGSYLHSAKLLGADEVLAKPFSCDELVAALDRVLALPEAAKK